MKCVQVSESQSYLKKIGRPRAVGREQILRAIRKYGITSESELAEKLNVGRTTIWRRLQEIPEEQIDAVLKELSETKLKPSQYDWKVFLKIPVIEDYEEKLREKIRVCERHKRKMLRGIWRACRILGRHPDHLTVEECASLVAKARVGEAFVFTRRGKKPIAEGGLRKSIRAFLQYMKGISGKLLTSEGIDASTSKVDPERARARFTPEQRKVFMEVLREKTKEDWEGRSGKTYHRLPFKGEPMLAKAVELLPYCYYYMGNRKKAVLNAKWENMEWREDISILWIIDKGLHRKGRKKWKKRITHELLERMRAFWEATGCPKEGLIFPFSKYQHQSVALFFKECYAEAEIPEKLWRGMPIHIWRHTACQDLLEATDRNWELVAEVLGWESLDTMKRHYGKASEAVIQRGLLEAMGFRVEWEKKDFKF